MEARLDKKTREALAKAQRTEVTEHFVYTRLAEIAKEGQNKRVLMEIARDEEAHARLLEAYTKRKVKPRKVLVFFYVWLARIFGLTFALRLMERGEEAAQRGYKEAAQNVPEIAGFVEDEDRHEQALLDMIEEERLKYASSVVLGLNDALVELTGAMAGFTLAMRNVGLIAAAGLITGVSAALSMAVSEYLSQKAEDDSGRNPLKSATYTGAAYIVAVLVLIAPYLLFSNPFVALALTLFLALTLIVGFTFYLAVARNRPFLRSALEMAFLSLGVALVSFGIGYLLRFAGVEV